MRKLTLFSISILTLLTLQIQSVRSQTSEFSYQGSLKNGTAPANGNHDFEFILYDALSGGNQIGPAVPVNGVPVAEGNFSVNLNFGNTFPGAARYLEIRVRPTGQPGMTILTPRQLLTSAPYSVKSLNAENATAATTANNALSLAGVAANQYVVTTDPRMADARPPTAGSPSYIQNGTSPQGSSNFNIANTGTAAIFNATTHYNIDGITVLSNRPGSVFVGDGAGVSMTTGLQNSFLGRAGGATTSGGHNTFAGWHSGELNTTGNFNSFFGHNAGRTNVTGIANTALGTNAHFASDDLTYATAIGADAIASASNSITLGRNTGQDMVHIPGNLRLVTLSTGGVTSICRNAFSLIATCSSSARYKSNVTKFTPGLGLIRQLRPVSFKWKEDGTPDLGLVAEEVNKIEPLLTTTNAKGEVEGVKYDRVGVVLVNAINEQQRYIENLEKKIEALKTLVCTRKSGAEICQPNIRR